MGVRGGEMGGRLAELEGKVGPAPEGEVLGPPWHAAAHVVAHVAAEEGLKRICVSWLR